jgi:methylmalonyl-CoA carboxyltransferase 12S subunit
MAKITMKTLAEMLEQLQAQLATLSERVERLEASTLKPAEGDNAPVVAATQESLPPEPAKPAITEEEVIAISAALGAYLGVRVRIKQIRLLGSHAWAQQGRVSVQASHNLHN